jgi:MFS family permease
VTRAGTDPRYGWVVVAAGAFITCVALGAVFTLPVFLQPITEATGWSRTGVSAAMTFVFLGMGLAGMGWGALSDRYGARIVVLAGSVLAGTGLILASQARSLLEFQLAYGVLVGVAAGAFFAPLMATVTNWFERHRALAVSLVSVGVGVAPMTVSPFASWLVSVMDWRSAQLTIGLLALGLLVPASLLVRPAPAPATGAAAGGGGAAAEPFPSVGAALRSPQFIVLGLTFFACCATHSGPIFHTISYAMACGIPALAAVSIYSVEGAAGLGGRLLLGVLADRYGAKPVIVGGLLVQALGAAAFLFVSRLGEFYAVAFIFGLAYGGVMPLYAVLAHGYFGPRIMGTVFGGAIMLSTLAMAAGPLAGGWIFDASGGYRWLYVGSFAVGLCAVLIALFFPRLPRSPQPVLQPA